jgi:AcrR family transcriptional regulator
MTRITLPQQRAQETRKRIIDAASQVFGRRGYGQATVEEIASEAGVSNGALYHHFASKEELFKAIVWEHLHEHRIELGALFPVSSFREAIERFAAYWLRHLETEHEVGSLIMECWTQATREPWARDAVGAMFRQGPDLIADMLRTGQSAGAVRSDLDIEAAALLLFAAGEGLALMKAIDPENIEFERLRRPWADLIERFVRAEGEADMGKLREGMAALVERQEEGQAASSQEINQ